MTLFTNRNIGIIALVVILGLILIAIFTCKSKENFKKKNNDNVKTIIDSEFKKIMGKTKFDKKQEIIVKKFIDDIVTKALSTKTSKMKPSNRAREILKENRKLLRKNKNIKILVKGNDRYIFDKKSNKLLERNIVENFDILNFAKGLGESLVGTYQGDEYGVRARYQNFTPPTACAGQEGLNPMCPRAEPPVQIMRYSINPTPFWERERCNNPPAEEKLLEIAAERARDEERTAELDEEEAEAELRLTEREAELDEEEAELDEQGVDERGEGRFEIQEGRRAITNERKSYADERAEIESREEVRSTFESILQEETEPFWSNYNNICSATPQGGELFPEGGKKPVQTEKPNHRRVLTEDGSEFTWEEYTRFLSSLNQEQDEQYQQDLQAWRDGPQTGYCCYGATNPDMGTCSKEPCPTALDEIIQNSPAIIGGLGLSLIAAGLAKVGITAAMAALLIKIGWILLIIAAVVFLIMIIMGIIGAIPSGKNKEVAKRRPQCLKIYIRMVFLPLKLMRLSMPSKLLGVSPLVKLTI